MLYTAPYEVGGAKGNFVALFEDENSYNKIIVPAEHAEVVKKYYELGKLNPENKTWNDIVVYIYVKIMFGHPLADGNKRLALWVLLTGFSNLCVNFADINEICKILKKEIQ